MFEDSLLPPHGNYAKLLSYQKAEVVYDLSFRFCDRFLKKGDRTIDQMAGGALWQTEHRRGQQSIRYFPRKPNLSSPMWPARVWKNCFWITGIFCACGISPSGKRTPKKPSMSASSVGSPSRPTRPIVSFATRAQPRSSPTSRSALFTKPTICSTSNCADWKKILCSRAACGSA